MNPTHIEHIGIAVKDLQASIALFEKLLGSPCYAIEEVAEQKVRTAFFRIGQTKIDHLAFAVPDVAGALQEAQTAGLQLIDAQPRKGAEGLVIAFLHPKSTSGVLTELCSHG
jgi:methylmalonyl-CoA/ethylmalonyl-CoA epimerase